MGNCISFKSAIVQRRVFAACVILLAVGLLAGCNVFSPFHSPGTSDNVNDLVSDAYEALDEEKYDKALEIMDRAMGIAPDDPQVRYLHAVTTVKSRDIDLLDVVEIFQPAEDGSLPVDEDNERILFLSGAELGNLYGAFRVVRADLKPLVDQIRSTGRELSKIRQSGDVLMSYGISETIVGMLRVLDNDETPAEFSLDDRIVIEKSDESYEIRIDDSLLDDAERDAIIDAAVDRAWPHFVSGRQAFFCYYQYSVREVIWTGAIPDPPYSLPETVDPETVIGSMAEFVDEGVRALYDEKEDL
jgi:hypothetical protein